jgi:hypothetical protein
MNPLDLDLVRQYVNENIDDFHQRRLRSLEQLRLPILLKKKNPYLFRAKNLTTANELIENLLSAFLSSAEEQLFGNFLEGLAIFIAEITCNGHKSTAPGVDLEFFNRGTHFVVSIKSGTNWGNSSQQKKLGQDLVQAETRLKQLRRTQNVQAVLGMCYGKTRTAYNKDFGYLKVAGQNFWYFISENEALYTDIIEPIGYRAREHNDAYSEERDRVINRFTRLLLTDFCEPDGSIDWLKLVKFNSSNLDLDRFFAN